MSCPVCGSQANKLFAVYDDRFGYPGYFPLFRCIGCGHGFLEADFSPELLRHLYSHYYPRATFDVQSHRPYHKVHGLGAWLDGEQSSVFRWVPNNTRVLDIGCGFGESLGYFEAQGCDAYGVEADENIRRVCEKFGYKIHIGLFDPNIYEANFFDYVTMSQVIEHVTDPVQTLRGISRVLKPGGVAILSTPNAGGWGAKLFGQRWINWHAPYHLQFFTRRSMQLAAEQAGLVVEKAVTITPSAWLHFQWIHLLSCPPEGKPSVFWAPGGKWSFMQKVALRVISITARCKIDHMVTRFFDAIGVGDNWLYLLRKP